MKALCTLWVLCFSYYCYGFSPIDFKNNQCDNISIKIDRNSFKKNPPLHFLDNQNHYFLQKQTQSGKNGYVFSSHSESSRFDLMLNSESRMIHDFLVKDNVIYLLADYTVYMYDLQSGAEIDSFITLSDVRSYKSHARAMELINDTLYIAHGSQGLLVFSLSEKKLKYRHSINTLNANGHNSRAESLTVIGRKLYVLMTASSEKGFDGIVVFDTLSRQILNLGEYKRSKGVVAPYAKIYHHKGMLYVNNMGWIHQFETKHVEAKRRITPKWLAIRGSNTYGRYYKMITGDLVFTDGQVLGCHLREINENGELQITSEVASRVY